MGGLLPAHVVVREARDLLELEDARSALLGGEVHLMSRAVPKRVREFATARTCARSALAELGIAVAPLMPDSCRVPRWPAGTVGSITHCEGFYGAAVAESAAITHVGIDAEPHADLASSVVDVVALPGEREQLDCLRRQNDFAAAGRLLFSAKEAVFKAAFPHDRRWRDFRDVSLDLRWNGTFSAVDVSGAPLPPLSGRWRAIGGLIITTAFSAPQDV